VAEAHGTFAKYGIEVRTEIAPRSDVLRADLAGARADIAHAAVDNAVAMDTKGRADVVIVVGGERSLNELIAQPGIHSIAELVGARPLSTPPTPPSLCKTERRER
jgi:ABC-type nitrate/sulfonate/bicarbonate transport system substrate-binding protein